MLIRKRSGNPGDLFDKSFSLYQEGFSANGEFQKDDFSLDMLAIGIRPGTRLFNNWRLIEYLKEATRSARLGTRSVLGAAGKVEI